MYFSRPWVVKETKEWLLFLPWVLRDTRRHCPFGMPLERCSIELSADNSKGLICSLFIIGHYRYLLQPPSVA